MTTNAEYQRRERSRRQMAGDVFIHVPVSPKAKAQLVTLTSQLNLTQRAVIEMLIDAGHKEMLK